MTELVKLKKGDKIITRTKFDYEKNLIHWKMRGYEPLEDKSMDQPIEEKPKELGRRKKINGNHRIFSSISRCAAVST